MSMTREEKNWSRRERYREQKDAHDMVQRKRLREFKAEQDAMDAARLYAIAEVEEATAVLVEKQRALIELLNQ